MPKRVVDAPGTNDKEALAEEVTVRDPRHPLFGRALRLAERRPEQDRRKERILAFLGDGPLVRIPAWALEEPRAGEPRTALSREAVEELVATARMLGVLPEAEHEVRSTQTEGSS